MEYWKQLLKTPNVLINRIDIILKVNKRLLQYSIQLNQYLFLLLYIQLLSFQKQKTQSMVYDQKQYLEAFQITFPNFFFLMKLKMQNKLNTKSHSLDKKKKNAVTTSLLSNKLGYIIKNFTKK